MDDNMDISSVLCCSNKNELRNLLPEFSIEELQKCIEDFYDMMHFICDEINKY